MAHTYIVSVCVALVDDIRGIASFIRNSRSCKAHQTHLDDNTYTQLKLYGIIPEIDTNTNPTDLYVTCANVHHMLMLAARVERFAPLLRSYTEKDVSQIKMSKLRDTLLVVQDLLVRSVMPSGLSWPGKAEWIVNQLQQRNHVRSRLAKCIHQLHHHHLALAIDHSFQSVPPHSHSRPRTDSNVTTSTISAVSGSESSDSDSEPDADSESKCDHDRDLDDADSDADADAVTELQQFTKHIQRSPASVSGKVSGKDADTDLAHQRGTVVRQLQQLMQQLRQQVTKIQQLQQHLQHGRAAMFDGALQGIQHAQRAHPVSPTPSIKIPTLTSNPDADRENKTPTQPTPLELGQPVRALTALEADDVWERLTAISLKSNENFTPAQDAEHLELVQLGYP